jgi:YD repeat-containing protein
VPNAGQHDVLVRFATRALRGSVFFTPDEVVLALPADLPATQGNGALRTHPRARAHTMLRLRYQSASATATISATERLPGIANYFLGDDPDKWRTNLPTYAGITYQQLYPGIDLSYSGAAGQLKATYLVAPGADPAQIRWRYQGASRVQLDADGNLLVTPTALLTVTNAVSPTLIEHAPLAWQTINGQQVPVSVSFSIAANHSISFVVGAYDPTQPLTIDPALTYSIYEGASESDLGYGIMLDSASNIYLTGTTNSDNFPTASPYQAAAPGGAAFVVKLAPSPRIKNITFEGGSLTDPATGVESTSGTVNLDSSTAIKGVYAARIPNIANSYLRQSFVAVDDLYVAFYLRVDAGPTTPEARIVYLVDTAGTTIGNIRLTNALKLRLKNNSTTIGADSAPLTLGTLYRIELRQKKGSGSNGILELYLVQDDAAFGAPVATLTTGTWMTRVNRIFLGATGSDAVSVLLDDISLDSAAMPGPTVAQSTRAINYSYDGMLRLTNAAESSGTSYAYSYDLAGNRTQVTVNGVVMESHSYNAANQIDGWAYDPDGNQLGDLTSTYSYDPLGRLTSVLKGSETRAYTYNGDGVLVAQTTNGVLTRYTQDLAAPLSQVLQTTQGSATTNYLYGLNRLASVAGSTRIL